MKQYHDALITEIKTCADQYQSDRRISTLFFGGGTPSTYPDELLLDTFDTLKSVYIFEDDCEITMEVNPGTVRIPEQLELWKAVGINRLSIGVQSLKDDVLQQLNRHQKAVDVMRLISAAESLFSNISIDLILGLPGVSVDEWKSLLHTVVQWPLKHISCYFLTVHEDTPLYFKVKKQQVTIAPDDESVDLYQWTRAFLENHGFAQYEMSNFARPGYACKHNQAYWNRVPYKGFGLGACSFDGRKRFENEKRLLVYLEQSGCASVISSVEELTSKQITLERLMLGLRRAQGIRWDDVEVLLSPQERTHFLNQVTVLKEHGMLLEIDNRLMLTQRGLVLENEVVVRLLL